MMLRNGSAQFLKTQKGKNTKPLQCVKLERMMWPTNMSAWGTEGNAIPADGL